MANLIYPRFKAAQMKALTADLSAVGTNVKVVLIDLQDYLYTATHEFLSDIPAIARVATSANLTNKTVSAADGTFDSDDPVFTAATGDQSEALALYIDTGTASTSRLIAYFDTGVVGLPVTPNGGDINITVNEAGWFTP
jgi:hypothetical protein